MVTWLLDGVKMSAGSLHRLLFVQTAAVRLISPGGQDASACPGLPVTVSVSITHI